ncbi:MAG TPA: hypothetical protein DCE41_10145 [Cytophagales bacterium]|nr:hypothetical protein [Cytophagales bacterium]HAA21029.1 hypothetical protein [Cytophagales bacterium]HAP61510.1 hypothetical protein [Cytophagales bacterium]
MFGGAPIIYRLFYWVLRLYHHAFFRSVYVVGRSKPDWTKPNMVASNHPNSFLDPVIYADSVVPVMHFLARGDVFKKGFVEWLFVRQFNMIPIYRKEETKNSGQKNKSIFRWVYRLLGEKANIVIYTEGHSVPEKRLRPLKKGTAWMAFGAMDEYGPELDVNIVPMVLNYQHSHKRNQTVMMNHGEPIRAIDYWDLYQTDQTKAVDDLTAELDKRMRPLMVTLDTPEADQLGYTALDIARNDAYQSKPQWVRKPDEAPPSFHAEKAMAKAVNTLYQKNPEEAKQWEEKAKNYRELLLDNKLIDEALSDGQKLLNWEKLLLWIGWPLFLLSRPFTAWPKRLGKGLVEKRKLWGTQWYLSIFYGLEWITFSVLFLLLVTLTFIFLGSVWGWISIPAIIFTSIYGERYSFLAYRSLQNGRWKRFQKKKPTVAKEIEDLRKSIAGLKSSN